MIANSVTKVSTKFSYKYLVAFQTDSVVIDVVGESSQQVTLQATSVSHVPIRLVSSDVQPLQSFRKSENGGDTINGLLYAPLQRPSASNISQMGHCNQNWKF